MCQATSVKVPQPDQGWAWVVAFACFTINFIMAGLARTAGVLYVALISLYGVSRQSATTPFSIRVCVRNMVGPVVGLLGQRYGIRPITMVGGIIAGLGGILCFFAPDITWITIFWGVVHGLGFSLSTVLHMISINKYFDKYRATALGIGFSGDCFGTFAFPVIIETLLYNYDVKGTFLIIGGIVLHIIPAALLLKDPAWLKVDNIKMQPGFKNEAFVQSQTSLNISTEDNEKLSNSLNVNKTKGLETGCQLVCNKREANDIEINNRRNSILSSIANGSIGPHSKDSPRTRAESWRQSSELIPHCVPEGVISFRNSNEVINMSDYMKNSGVDIAAGNILDANELLNNIRPRSVSNYESSLGQQTFQTRQNSLPRGLQYSPKEKNKHCSINLIIEDNLRKSDLGKKLSNQISFSAKELEELKELEESEKSESEKNDSQAVQEQSLTSLFFRTNIKPIFVLISVSMGAYAFLFIAVLTVIIDYAADHGVEPNDGKFLVIGFSIADLIGRLSFGQIIDRKLVTMKIYAGMTVSLMGLTICAIPLNYSFNYMMACMAFYGLVQGGTAIMFPILVGHYMEKNEESIAMGCLNFYGGLLMLPMAPMIGFFRDSIGSYNGMFYIVGGICIFVGLLWQLEPFLVNKEVKSKK